MRIVEMSYGKSVTSLWQTDKQAAVISFTANLVKFEQRPPFRLPAFRHFA
jgi:hypothetical protein